MPAQHPQVQRAPAVTVDVEGVGSGSNATGVPRTYITASLWQGY